MIAEHVSVESLQNGSPYGSTAGEYLILLSHGRSLLAEWDHLQQTLHGDLDVRIDGQSLRIADVVAVSQYVAPMSRLVCQPLSQLRGKIPGAGSAR